MQMKNKRILSWLLAVVMVLSLLPATALAADFPGSGSGTEADPYVVTTAEELNAVRNDLSACYKLGNNIDLSQTDYAGAWTPIGSYMPDASDPSGETPDAAYAFTGTFDGDGNKITGLTITDGSMCDGLFGIVANGTVEDLTIENATVTGNRMTAAAIGYAYQTTVNNVDLAGTNTITGSLNDGAAPNMVAGVVGAGMDSNISGCDITGTTLTMESVSDAAALGGNVHDAGLVGGGLEGCNLKECSAENSRVTVNGAYCFGIGGLSGCAISAESVTDCDVTNVIVTVGDNAYLVGGLTGYTGQDGDKTATQVSGCSASATIAVGENSSRVGGLVGGGFYLEMYRAYYPVPSRFDLTGCTTAGTIDAGAGSTAIGTVVGYACLCDTEGGTSTMAGDPVGKEQEPFVGGSGTAEAPYQISNAAQLYAMRYDLDAYYELTANIDLAEQLGDFYIYTGWAPIGVLTYSGDVNMETGEMDMNKVFSGGLDGGGHTISNVNVATDGDLLAAGGLFACSTGTVENLNMENVTVTGDETTMAVGGVVGYAMSGTISNVTLTGANTVTGTNCVGGIAGGSMVDVSGCTVEGTTGIVVTGDNDFSNGRIIQCDTAECGGLVVGGGFNGSVKNCTATGTVTATGNEPVGLGGIGGCLQCMAEISGNEVTVTITTTQGGHAIGGLCGYAGMGDDGSGYDQAGNYHAENRTVADPSEIKNCTVNVTINAPGATHVGGLVGTGLYFYGMEDRFTVTNCTVTGTITAGTDETSPYGVTTPGAVAGRAVGCNVDGCTFDGLTINAETATNPVGTTSLMYESADQYDEDASGALLYGLTDTYQPLFEGATFNGAYDHYWHDYAAAVAGGTGADAMVDMMKSAIGGTLYGQEAVEAYQDDPDSAQFFCGFTGNVATFTFNGSQISGYRADGEEIFSHPYRYVGEDHLYMGETPVMDARVFESLDDNSGQFRYFFLCGDTPDTTYHIEFRYGSERGDNLNQYSTGDCAYWLAAGIPTSALTEESEENIANVIALFCVENLAEMTTAETVSQRADLTGTWDADLSGFPEYAGASLYCVLNADGTGTTYMNGTEADSYQFYAYDNNAYDNNASAKSGVYIARDDDSCEASRYDVTTSGGKTVLTFYTLDGEQISYIKRATKSHSSGSDDSYTVSAPSSVENGSVSISHRSAVEGVTVTITVKPDSGYALDALTVTDGRGKEVAITDKGDGKYTFTMPDAQVSVKASFRKEEAGENGFSDVAANAYYADAVQWAVGEGITNGTTSTTFAPNTACTRAQIVTFLWRAMGSPEPTSATNAFTDVTTGAYYYKAVLWAAEKGITAAISDTTFGPDETVTRAQTVTFLWRAAGEPASTATNPFTDVDSGAYYSTAVLWAVNEGVTTGTGATTFGPANPTTRGQIVTFLYRYLGQ